MVKKWVNLLTWLLIGCSLLCSQSGAMTCLLTQLLTMTTTHKFPSLDVGVANVLVLVLVVGTIGRSLLPDKNKTKYGNKKVSLIRVMIWRGTPSDKADVPTTKLPFTYRISTLSFPLQSCPSRYNYVVIFLKGLFFASACDSSGAGTRVSKSGTWTAAFWRRRRLRHLAFLFMKELPWIFRPGTQSTCRQVEPEK